MIRLLFSALLALSLFGQNPNTAAFPTTVAVDQNLLSAKRLSESSLNGSINASTTTVVVSDGTQFLNWQIIRIDSEEMLIQSVSSNTLTIVSGGRGYNGTTAASHTTGAAVRGIITSWHHNQLAAEVKAIETRLRNVTGQCQDAGSTDDYACSPAPPFTAYATGMIVNFKAATANTGAATVNFNSIGAGAIKKVAGGVTTALDDNDIRAGQWVTVVYDGTNFQMISALGNAGSSSGSGISSCVPTSASATAYTCTPSPAVGSYTTGLTLAFKPDIDNSGNATVDVNGLGVKNLVTLTGSGVLGSLSAGDIQADAEYVIIYDGTYFQVIGKQLAVDIIANEGSSLTKRSILDFLGAGVNCIDNAGGSRTECTIPADAVKAGSNTWSGVNDFGSATGMRLRFGSTAAASGDCDSAGELGGIYVQSGDPASVATRVSICTQTGASSYAWNPVSHKVGTTAPATCVTGEVFFDSDATAGSNWLGCTSANTWTQLGGSGGGGTAATRAESETGTNNTAMTTPLAATYSVASAGACGLVSESSDTTIRIFPGATTAHPCIAQVGNVTRRFTASATVVLGASSVSVNGSKAYFYVKPNGTIYAGLPAAFTQANITSSGVTEETASDFPTGVHKIGTWLAGTTDDQWDSTGGDGNGGENYISLRTKSSLLAGTGVTVTENSDGEETIATDTTTIPTKDDVVTNGLRYAVTAGTSTAYTLSTPYALASPNANGVCVLGKMDETSGATPTLSVNSATARAIWKHNGTSAAGAVATGDLIANQIYEFCHNTSLNTSGVWIAIPGGGGSSGSVATDTIFDAKGDLAIGTGADTAQKLTLGSNGMTPIAASGETTGVKWGYIVKEETYPIALCATAIPAGGWGVIVGSEPSGTGSCGGGYTSGLPSQGFFSFSDGANTYAAFSWRLPSTFVSLVSVTYHVSPGGASGGNFALKFGAQCFSSTDNWLTGSTSFTDDSIFTGAAGSTGYAEQAIVHTTTNVDSCSAAGARVAFKVGREGTDGGDTNTNDMVMTAMTIKYTVRVE